MSLTRGHRGLVEDTSVPSTQYQGWERAFSEKKSYNNDQGIYEAEQTAATSPRYFFFFWSKKEAIIINWGAR